MARQARRRARPGDGGGGGGTASLNPVEILSGWGEAVRIAAGALIAPPLALCGIALEAPRKGELAQAARGFPVVGLGIGLAAALAYAISDGLGLPPLISAIFAIAVMAFATGARPEGGLARMADATVAAGAKAERLRILKEERFAQYGILVLLVAFALRVGAVAWIAAPGPAALALIAAAAASYGVLPAVLHTLPAARRSGLAFTAGEPRLDQAVLAAALGAAVALLFLGPMVGIVALAVGALGALKFAWLARRMIGGVTTSVLGAVQQGAEIGVLLAVVAMA